MHVHEEVLETARRLAAGRRDWNFTVKEIVEALPTLNQSTVRTHVVSRCCVNAPKNHLHKWAYFRRVGRGRYRIEPEYRKETKTQAKRRAPSEQQFARTGESRRPRLRRALHAVIEKDGDFYVVECLELPIVTQGRGLDEAVENFREAMALHLEGEDLAALGFATRPDVQISYEMTAA